MSGNWLHLARRFFGSLSSEPPGSQDQEWVAAQLDPAVLALWQRMSPADQRHSVAVGRNVASAGVERDAVAAALMHDVGKLDSDLGTFSRVGATVIAGALGDVRVASWSSKGGVVGRLGRYRNHGPIGAELLAEAGAPEVARQWASEHHLSAQSCRTDPELADLLRAADDD